MSTGRFFVLRLRQGEILHETVESFAAEKGITNASVSAVGGADDRSEIVMGPRDGSARPIEPILHRLDGVHEMAGVGSIFPDEDSNPILHMHASFGRDGRSVTGCVRAEVRVWLVMEVLIQELLGGGATRVMDPESGFALLEVNHDQ